MTIELFAHPFSSYCQKVLVALYENATPFTLRMLGITHPGTAPLIPADPAAALKVRPYRPLFPLGAPERD
ncbi:MAG: glutathione S-transferase N-terminal domain-containing protein [Blastomonas fulva]|uniref:glutathione S-transferase N-terminal domain-containing protein n=1 Tax=Blastomonas fulva TaxID=1550728 RepID=UPI0025897F4E|nr:glutathione S-transferase N-terminal domain-containing protein [Blastomonas sp.]